jgi:hypothetical protein
VAREKHGALEEALGAMRTHVQRIRREGDLPEVTMLRTFEPGERVHARIELSTGGWLRGRDAGIDVMGDGALIPYAGGARKRPLDLPSGEDVFEAVGAAIEE